MSKSVCFDGEEIHIIDRSRPPTTAALLGQTVLKGQSSAQIKAVVPRAGEARLLPPLTTESPSHVPTQGYALDAEVVTLATNAVLEKLNSFQKLAYQSGVQAGLTSQWGLVAAKKAEVQLMKPKSVLDLPQAPKNCQFEDMELSDEEDQSVASNSTFDQESLDGSGVYQNTKKKSPPILPPRTGAPPPTIDPGSVRPNQDQSIAGFGTADPVSKYPTGNGRMSPDQDSTSSDGILKLPLIYQTMYNKVPKLEFRTRLLTWKTDIQDWVKDGGILTRTYKVISLIGIVALLYLMIAGAIVTFSGKQCASMERLYQEELAKNSRLTAQSRVLLLMNTSCQLALQQGHEITHKMELEYQEAKQQLEQERMKYMRCDAMHSASRTLLGQVGGELNTFKEQQAAQEVIDGIFSIVIEHRTLWWHYLLWACSIVVMFLMSPWNVPSLVMHLAQLPTLGQTMMLPWVTLVGPWSALVQLGIISMVLTSCLFAVWVSIMAYYRKYVQIITNTTLSIGLNVLTYYLGKWGLYMEMKPLHAAFMMCVMVLAPWLIRAGMWCQGVVHTVTSPYGKTIEHEQNIFQRILWRYAGMRQDPNPSPIHLNQKKAGLGNRKMKEAAVEKDPERKGFFEFISTGFSDPLDATKPTLEANFGSPWVAKDVLERITPYRVLNGNGAVVGCSFHWKGALVTPDHVWHAAGSPAEMVVLNSENTKYATKHVGKYTAGREVMQAFRPIPGVKSLAASKMEGTVSAVGVTTNGTTNFGVSMGTINTHEGTHNVSTMPGDSGSPICDIYGKLLGVHHASTPGSNHQISMAEEQSNCIMLNGDACDCEAPGDECECQIPGMIAARMLTDGLQWDCYHGRTKGTMPEAKLLSSSNPFRQKPPDGSETGSSGNLSTLGPQHVSEYTAGRETSRLRSGVESLTDAVRTAEGAAKTVTEANVGKNKWRAKKHIGKGKRPRKMFTDQEYNEMLDRGMDPGDIRELAANKWARVRQNADLGSPHDLEVPIYKRGDKLKPGFPDWDKWTGEWEADHEWERFEDQYVPDESYVVTPAPLVDPRFSDLKGLNVVHFESWDPTTFACGLNDDQIGFLVVHLGVYEDTPRKICQATYECRLVSDEVRAECKVDPKNAFTPGHLDGGQANGALTLTESSIPSPVLSMPLGDQPSVAHSCGVISPQNESVSPTASSQTSAQLSSDTKSEIAAKKSRASSPKAGTKKWKAMQKATMEAVRSLTDGIHQKQGECSNT